MLNYYVMLHLWEDFYLKDGYNYNQLKKEHIYFIIDNGTKKLNWNDAVIQFLDKKQPSPGDYFYFKK